MQDPARFERGTCARQSPLFTSHKCEDSRGTAGAVLDLDRCDDERSSRRRQAAEIRHIFEVIFSFAMTDVVNGKVLRHAVIHTQRIDPNARDISLLGQQLRRFGRKPREVQGSVLLRVLVFFEVRPAFVPSCVHHHHGILWNWTIGLFPRRDVRRNQNVIRISRNLRTDIDDDSRREEFFRRYLVE